MVLGIGIPLEAIIADLVEELKAAKSGKDRALGWRGLGFFYRDLQGVL